MEIQTVRLVLRRFHENDFEDLYPLDEDPRVMKYIWKCKPKPTAKSEALLRFKYMLEYYDRFPGLGVFATCLKETGELIGWTLLKDLDKSEYTEIGYRYFFRFWNKGYATEAATALLKYGFVNQKLDKIVAVTHPENEASKNVLIKIGLEYKREDFFYNTDIHFFELNRENYLRR
ncbi:MAG: GNAT family N-acetyltransferase [Bacteroidetes bacterium]|nr:GNAT family N-acetyltransferase [Bacteroidota bacterium]